MSQHLPADGQGGALDAHPVMARDILHGVHLLEADAGTGKTWTLSGLVLRALVERELPIDQILVVTFTIPATAELARRIRERIDLLALALEQRLAGDVPSVDDLFCRRYAAGLPDPARARALLRVARSRIDEASVRTIHGFCQRVIAEHALSIGLGGGLEPQANTQVFHWRLIARWWREHLLEAPADQLALVRLGGVSPDALVKALVSIAAQPAIRLRGGPLPWREAAARLHGLRGELARWLEQGDEVQRLLDWLNGPSGIKRTSFKSNVQASRLAALREFAVWEGPLSAAPFGKTMADAIWRFSAQGLASIGAHLPAPVALVELCESLLPLREAAAQVTGWIAADIWASTGPQRQQVRREAGALGFDDLLAIVHRALREPGSGARLAQGLRERHPLALIDECQDTDPLQWEIFRRIYLPDAVSVPVLDADADADADAAAAAAAADRPADWGASARTSASMVLVGDPKQAIYGFRGADIFAYLEAREAITDRHSLTENQRSSAELIQAVNAVFSAPAPFLIPQIGFVPAAAGQRTREPFHPAAGDHDSPLQFVCLRAGSPERLLPRPRAFQTALTALGARIAGLLRSGARLGERELRAADIAVLVNSHHEASAVKAQLAQQGIGAAEISRASVLDSAQCDDLLRLCTAIAEPGDAGRLGAALCTGLAGLNARRLRELAADPVAWAEQIEHFALARAQWSRLGSQAALRGLLHTLGTGVRLAGLRDGERQLTNLGHLLELLSGSDEAQRGPQSASDWLMRLRADPAGAAPDSLELRLESNDDLVRIVTVHKSKGLEYPIVFLPFAWSGKAFKAEAPIRYHERGAGGQGWVGYLDFEARKESEEARQAGLEAHSEAARVLYVALTRARHRCYVFWGAAAGAQFSTLAWLLNGLDPGQQTQWKSNSRSAPPLTDALIDAGIEGLRSRLNAGVGAKPTRIIGALEASAWLEASPPADLQAARTDSPDTGEILPMGPVPAQRSVLAARRLGVNLPSARVHLSFTALAARLAGRGGAPLALAEENRVQAVQVDLPDRDDQPDDAPVPAAQDSRDAAPAPSETALAPRSIRWRFPAGAQAGICLHGILEKVPWSAPPASEVLARALAGAGLDTDMAPELAVWLAEVLGAALPGHGGAVFRLCDLDPSRCLSEMEFLLPATGLSSAALIDAIASEFPLDKAAARENWSGFLRGFIDLIFEAQGRWWILDWKSNYLGDEVSAYGPAGLARSVAEHAYALQFCLYSLALHRLLSVRLPGYSPATHFGGVFYLYLRGAGAPAPKSPMHYPGVYAARPSDALLTRLDGLFRGPT